MAQLAKVNIVYMSHIMRSNFTYHDSKTGENRAISERWFRQLADCIGLKPEKDYWPHVDTPQFKEIDMELRPVHPAFFSAGAVRERLIRWNVSAGSFPPVCSSSAVTSWIV